MLAGRWPAGGGGLTIVTAISMNVRSFTSKRNHFRRKCPYNGNIEHHPHVDEKSAAMVESKRHGPVYDRLYDISKEK